MSISLLKERCLSVVMPVYNEAATVEAIVGKVIAQPQVAELIIVDDASTDGTGAVLEKISAQHRFTASDPQASVAPESAKPANTGSDPESDVSLRILRHSVNQGKGAALRTGIAEATAPLVIIQDADFEYNPEEYPIMLMPILDGRADVVFGSRFIGSEAHRVLYFWHAVGNRFLTLLSNMFTNLNLTDMETCYKAFRREIIQAVDIKENRFGFEPEIVAKLARRNLRIYEVAISYAGRTYAEGKKIDWKDGISALRCIIKYNQTCPK